jgi:sulfatase maturation enzyme AslB (radical SAM superfamily)
MEYENGKRSERLAESTRVRHPGAGGTRSRTNASSATSARATASCTPASAAPASSARTSAADGADHLRPFVGLLHRPDREEAAQPLLPGSSILSFGTAGCNLACKFCQNWDISKSKDMDRLLDAASPEGIAAAAVAYGASRWPSPTTTR